MKHCLLLIFTCCFLFSCQKDYFIDDFDFQPRLVVNSLFTEGSEIVVDIHSSRNVLESNSEIKSVENAEVLLKDASGNLLAILDNVSGGRYLSNSVNLKVGEQYTLEVNSQGFESVTATSMIPYQVVATLGNKEFVSGETSASLNVDINLRDNDASDNYYVYEVVDDLRLHLLKEQPFINELEQVSILLTSEDANQEQVATNNLLQSRVFLKDVAFANAEYNINFKAKSNPANGPVELVSEDVFSDKKMRVVTASKTMYEFYKSVEKNRLRGDANSSIAQPAAIYSNIEGGLGVFAGYNESVLPLNLQ